MPTYRDLLRETDRRHVIRAGHDASRAVDSDPGKAMNPHPKGTPEFYLWRWGWNMEWQSWYGEEDAS